MARANWVATRIAISACESHGILKRIRMNRMRPIKRSPITAWVTCFSLAVSLCAGIMVGDRANAASPSGLAQPTDKSERSAKAGYPTLSRYAIDLTKQARQGQLDPVT